MDTNNNDDILPSIIKIEDLDHVFSDMSGNAIMEEIKLAVKEFILENGKSDAAGDI